MNAEVSKCAAGNQSAKFIGSQQADPDVASKYCVRRARRTPGNRKLNRRHVVRHYRLRSVTRPPRYCFKKIVAFLSLILSF
jgi:hypothetical protein